MTEAQQAAERLRKLIEMFEAGKGVDYYTDEQFVADLRVVIDHAMGSTS